MFFRAKKYIPVVSLCDSFLTLDKRTFIVLFGQRFSFYLRYSLFNRVCVLFAGIISQNFCYTAIGYLKLRKFGDIASKPPYGSQTIAIKKRLEINLELQH